MWGLHTAGHDYITKCQSFSDRVVTYGILNNDEKHMQSMQKPASTFTMLLFVNLPATLAWWGWGNLSCVKNDQKQTKKILANNVLQYRNAPLVVSRKSTNVLIFTVAIGAYGVCLLPTEHLRTARSTAGVAFVKSCGFCPFKLDLNSAVSPCWSQLNDLVPFANRSGCLQVRVLMRGP